MTYQDNGKFRMRIFGQRPRTLKEVNASEIKITEMFGLSDYTTFIEEFNHPFITCCFVGESKIFVAVFHNRSNYHYHFMWDLENKVLIGEKQFDFDGNSLPDKPIKYFMDTNEKNFPYKCFYSETRDECYVFYR